MRAEHLDRPGPWVRIVVHARNDGGRIGVDASVTGGKLKMKTLAGNGQIIAFDGLIELLLHLIDRTQRQIDIPRIRVREKPSHKEYGAGNINDEQDAHDDA